MTEKNVLLVDDDAIFREAVSVVLESCYQVATASNGSEALARIGEQPPDLVILDVMMDHLSEGFEVAQTLRSRPETASIPIILLTGVDQVFHRRMQVDEASMPCDRYLEKPVDPIDLLTTARDLLEKP
jgi:CheY-like chemotaxis protein